MKNLKAVAIFIAAGFTTGIIALYSWEPVNQSFRVNMGIYKSAKEILKEPGKATSPDVQMRRALAIRVFAANAARIKLRLPVLCSDYEKTIERLKENLNSTDIVLKLSSAKALERIPVKNAEQQVVAAYRDIILQALKDGVQADSFSSPNVHIGEALEHLANYKTPETAALIRQVLENPALNKAKPIWYSGCSDCLELVGKKNYVQLNKSEVAALLANGSN